ncbi:5'-nucleotidase SurE, partial [Clarias magur]
RDCVNIESTTISRGNLDLSPLNSDSSACEGSSLAKRIRSGLYIHWILHFKSFLI